MPFSALSGYRVSQGSSVSRVSPILMLGSRFPWWIQAWRWIQCIRIPQIHHGTRIHHSKRGHVVNFCRLCSYMWGGGPTALTAKMRGCATAPH
jgi:hypothetical protein